MPTIRQVVCLVDFSSLTEAAVQAAARLALHLELPVHLVHVLPPGPMGAGDPEVALALLPSFVPDEAQRQADARRQLEVFRSQLEARGLKASYALLTGRPGTELVAYLRTREAPLAVMGTHGHSPMGRFLLGSTTVEVLRKVTCPVLSVRATQPTVALSRIGVALDFSKACEPALELALELARQTGAELHLLHVVVPIELVAQAEAEIPLSFEASNQQLEQAARTLLTRLAGRLPDLSVVPEVLVGGSPYRELVRYATAAGLDLLAVGTHGRTGLRRLFLGSVMERLLQVSPCPVLSVRAAGEVPDDLTWQDVSADLSGEPG